MNITPSTMLHCHVVHRTRDINGNSRIFIQVLVLDKEGQLRNISARLASQYRLRHSRKYNALTTQVHGSRANTLCGLLSHHLGFEPCVLETLS